MTPVPIADVLASVQRYGVFAMDLECRAPHDAPSSAATNARIAIPTHVVIGAPDGAAVLAPDAATIKILHNLFARADLTAYVHYYLYDLIVLHECGMLDPRTIRARLIDPITLQFVLHDRAEAGLKELVKRYFHRQMRTYKETTRDNPHHRRVVELRERIEAAHKALQAFQRIRPFPQFDSTRVIRVGDLRERADRDRETLFPGRLNAAGNRVFTAEERQGRKAIQDKLARLRDQLFGPVAEEQFRVWTSTYVDGLNREIAGIEQTMAEEFIAYAADDGYWTARLGRLLDRKVRAASMEYWADIEHHSRRIGLSMSVTGTPIDLEQMRKFRSDLQPIQQELQATVYDFAKREFDVDSNTQLRRLLFVDMKLTPPLSFIDRHGRFIPKLAPKAQQMLQNDELDVDLNRPETLTDVVRADYLSVDREVLERLAHPIGQAILNYRVAQKIDSTYATTMIERAERHPRHRLCGTFESSGAKRTGRWSCVAGWTRIETKRGLIPITDVVVGDYVWTHRHRWRPVTATIIKGVDEMVAVTFDTGEILTCTEHHRLLNHDGRWVPVKELVDERVQEVGGAGTESYRRAAPLPINRAVDDGGDLGPAVDHAAQRHGRLKRVHAGNGEESVSQDPVLQVEDGREKPDDRQNREDASRLDRGVPGRIRVPDRPVRRQTTVRSPTGDGASLRLDAASRNPGRASHRLRSGEQRAGQPGARDLERTSNYSFPAGEGQPQARIEKIDRRGCFTVYDLTVEEDASYFACGVFSHNSKQPNLQNIPSRSKGLAYDPRVKKLGKALRRSYIAEPGKKLIIADMSQIELRGITHTCDEPRMREIYEEGVVIDGVKYYTGDIHRVTAAQLGIDRTSAKPVNFGFNYGMGPEKFCRATPLYKPGTFEYDIERATAWRSGFFETYCAIPEFFNYAMERWSEGIRDVRLLSGRVKHFLPMEEKGMRGGKILNAIVQGSCADLLKAGISALDRFVLPLFPSLEFLFQVHDEVGLMIDAADAEDAAILIKYVLETKWLPISTPLLTTVKVCTAWSDKDEDTVPEVGSFYARVAEQGDRIFTAANWSEFVALDHTKRIELKASTAVLSTEQRRRCAEIIPATLPELAWLTEAPDPFSTAPAGAPSGPPGGDYADLLDDVDDETEDRE